MTDLRIEELVAQLKDDDGIQLSKVKTVKLVGFVKTVVAEAVADVQKGSSVTYCAYCGETFGEDAADAVSAHIQTCERHPMRQLEADYAIAAKAAKALRQRVEKVTVAVEKFFAVGGCYEDAVSKRSTVFRNVMKVGADLKAALND